MSQRQQKWQQLAMTDAELNRFLESERTCRVATLGSDGPHVTALWFLWDGTSIWLSSLVRSRRFANLRRDRRAALIVDAGCEFMELRGVEVTGCVEVVGEIPRAGEVSPCLEEVERQYSDKYLGGEIKELRAGTHAWLRLTPREIVSWDYRKLGATA
jgi:nitroimidazol reductase NimA-like FMN-containing flavoprotein (pyridoxamine 5'-phosphate oxidase superfamily)